MGEGLRAAQAGLVPLHQVPTAGLLGLLLRGEGRASVAVDTLAVNPAQGLAVLAQLGWGTGRGQLGCQAPDPLSGHLPSRDRPKSDLKPTFPPPGFVAPTHLCFSIEASGPDPSHPDARPHPAHLEEPSPQSLEGHTEGERAALPEKLSC